MVTQQARPSCCLAQSRYSDHHLDLARYFHSRLNLAQAKAEERVVAEMEDTPVCACKRTRDDKCNAITDSGESNSGTSGESTAHGSG